MTSPDDDSAAGQATEARPTRRGARLLKPVRIAVAGVAVVGLAVWAWPSSKDLPSGGTTLPTHTPSPAEPHPNWCEGLVPEPEPRPADDPYADPLNDPRNEPGWTDEGHKTVSVHRTGQYVDDTLRFAIFRVVEQDGEELVQLRIGEYRDYVEVCLPVGQAFHLDDGRWLTVDGISDDGASFSISETYPWWVE